MVVLRAVRELSHAVLLDMPGQGRGMDLLFRDRESLGRLVPRLLHWGVVALARPDRGRFRGKKVTRQGNAAAGLELPGSSDLKIRSRGARIQHRLGAKLHPAVRQSLRGTRGGLASGADHLHGSLLPGVSSYGRPALGLGWARHQPEHRRQAASRCGLATGLGPVLLRAGSGGRHQHAGRAYRGGGTACPLEGSVRASAPSTPCGRLRPAAGCLSRRVPPHRLSEQRLTSAALLRSPANPGPAAPPLGRHQPQAAPAPRSWAHSPTRSLPPLPSERQRPHHHRRHSVGPPHDGTTDQCPGGLICFSPSEEFKRV